MPASLASTPAWPTSSWWPFPPRTREVQLDEKWAFVARKHRQEADERQWMGQAPPPASDLPPALAGAAVGDCWDHVAFDPEHRLVLAAVVGRHSVQSVRKLMGQLKKRLTPEVRPLFTSDAYGPYETVIRLLWSPPTTASQPLKRQGQRPSAMKWVPGPSSAMLPLYARVNKSSGAGVRGGVQVVFGSDREVAAALEASTVSRVVNTSLLERAHATDRHRNARKARCSYRFSKDWAVHGAVSLFTLFCYNFCWCVRTLSVKGADGHRHKRTPAMAAGLADHAWSLEEWLRRPVPQLNHSG